MDKKCENCKWGEFPSYFPKCISCFTDIDNEKPTNFEPRDDGKEQGHENRPL
jgi:hypothetical protein